MWLFTNLYNARNDYENAHHSEAADSTVSSHRNIFHDQIDKLMPGYENGTDAHRDRIEDVMLPMILSLPEELKVSALEHVTNVAQVRSSLYEFAHNQLDIIEEAQAAPSDTAEQLDM